MLDPKCVGRKNFTIAHELAHQIINREFPQMYDPQYRTFCDYRRSSAEHKKISDWYEWQADALAAALLLPKDALLDSMFLFGLGDKMKVLSKKYSSYNYERFCNMVEFLQVSKTALSYRMEQLGLLERNYLLKEAVQRKGEAYVFIDFNLLPTQALINLLGNDLRNTVDPLLSDEQINQICDILNARENSEQANHS